MTLRHFKIFLQVCDSGNMTAAAEILHIAQPSISQAIGELERHYHVKLFERLGRRLFLTAAGQKLLTYARHIVHLQQEADGAMRALETSGQLRVGASVTVGAYLLPELLTAFHAEYPQVELFSWVNNTKVIEAKLLADELDIAVVEGELHTAALAELPIWEDELVLVCAPQHPLAALAAVHLEQVAEYPLVVREEGSGTRELFDSVLRSRGLTSKLAGVYNSAEAIKAVVEAGLGITIISQLTVAKERQAGRLTTVTLADVSLKRQFRLVYHKNKFVSPLLQAWMEMCQGWGQGRKKA